MTMPAARTTVNEALTPEFYLRQRCALIRFFEWNGARDPTDLADEVFCRLLEGKAVIDSVPAFIHGVAQNVLQEYWRGRAREQNVVFEIARFSGGCSMAETLAHDMEECLKCLTRKERSLLKEYYAYQQGQKVAHRRRLAARLDLTLNALRIKATRAREKLAHCLEKRRDS